MSDLKLYESNEKSNFSDIYLNNVYILIKPFLSIYCAAIGN